MKKLALFIALLAMLPALAQQRDKALTIAVSTAGGAVVTDASVKLTQTDYSLSYGTLKLNAQGAVTVKVTADGVTPGSRKVLTTCGGFEGAAVTLAADAPDWAKGRLTVNADGNIVLDVQPKGTVIAIR